MIAPSPVTTTRRFITPSTFWFEIRERITDGAKLLGILVGNVDVELLLELHHQLDDVEAVGAEVLDEAGLVGELLTLDAELLLDDVFDLLRVVGHELESLCAMDRKDV